MTDFDRANICINVYEKKDMLADITSLSCVNVGENGRYSFDGCTIIYCLSINTCEEMNLNLQRAKGFFNLFRKLI